MSTLLDPGHDTPVRVLSRVPDLAGLAERGPVMPSRFTSFGWKHGPPAKQPGVLVLDVRDWPGIRNPWRVRGFQERNGRDPDVQHYIATGPGFAEGLDAIRDRVKDHPGPVWIGCQGGHHRSVYLVELLSAFFEVEHEHRDINRR